MKKEIISLADFRKNISTLWKKAKKENIKYIVLVHSKPVFEVIPIKKAKKTDAKSKKNNSQKKKTIKESNTKKKKKRFVFF